MKKRFFIITIMFVLMFCLTGCATGIKSENAQKSIIDEVSKGLKTGNYEEFEKIISDYNNDMSSLVGDKNFSNELYKCIKSEYDRNESKDNYHKNLNSLLYILEEKYYKDNDFRSKMHNLFLEKNSTLIDKLNLYNILEDSEWDERIDYYKKELINRNDIESYINSNAKKTINESGNGGYYDDSNNHTLKAQGRHYEGWHTKSSSVDYSGDFAYEYIWDEYVDETYYEIHHNDHAEIYFKGTKLDTTIDKIPENSYYASPYLFVYKGENIYILKVDDEVYASILYTYPEKNY